MLAVPWLCHAGCALLPLPCWICLSYQEKVLELARPQLALVPLGYSMSLLLWDPHGPGTQLPFQSVIWQVKGIGERWQGEGTAQLCSAGLLGHPTDPDPTGAGVRSSHGSQEPTDPSFSTGN